MQNKPRDFKTQKRSDGFQNQPKPFKQPKPEIQTTSLWDFPSQHYGEDLQGDGEYAGVTPSYVIWNLLHRYTKPEDKVLDPMCGSGTTLDVCKDLNRIGIGYDLTPKRADIKKADARKLPVAAESIDFIFVDPPYSNHIHYSDDEKCIGKLEARTGDYYLAMEEVIANLYRHLKDGGYFAMYIQDSFAKGKDFAPLGFEMFLRLCALMDPVDIITVVRNNKKLKRNHWHTSAIEGNYYLRGFNYLFIFRKNKSRNPQLLKHEGAGSLSQYFKQASTSRPGEVMTPEKLSQIVKEEQALLDQKLKAEKTTSKPKFKEPLNKSKFPDQKWKKNAKQRSK